MIEKILKINDNQHNNTPTHNQTNSTTTTTITNPMSRSSPHHHNQRFISYSRLSRPQRSTRRRKKNRHKRFNRHHRILERSSCLHCRATGLGNDCDFQTRRRFHGVPTARVVLVCHQILWWGTCKCMTITTII